MAAPFRTLSIDPSPGVTYERTVTPGAHVAVLSGARPGLFLGFDDPSGNTDVEVSSDAFDVLTVPTDRIWIRADSELEDQGRLVLGFFHTDTGRPHLAPPVRVLGFGVETVSAFSTATILGPFDPTRAAGDATRTQSRRLEASFDVNLNVLSGGGTASALAIILEHSSGDFYWRTRAFSDSDFKAYDGSKIRKVWELDCPMPMTRWRIDFENQNTTNDATIRLFVQAGT